MLFVDVNFFTHFYSTWSRHIWVEPLSLFPMGR